MKKSSNSAIVPRAASALPESLRTCDTQAAGPDNLDDAIGSRVVRGWRAACAGLRSIVEFGALLIEVETWLKKRGGGSYNMHAGVGLKAWLSEHAPEVEYHTAMGYKYAASGLLALADKAKDRPLLELMGEAPLTTEEEKAAREQVREIIATSSLRLLKAAAKADDSKAGPKKGGTSEGKRAKEPLALSEEWMQRAEAAAGELGGVCMVAQAELLLANPDRLAVVRSHVRDCLRVLDGLVEKSEAAR